MTVLTDSAGSRLQDYLTQVRAALAAHPDISSEEVTADVQEHIDTEFANVNRPVTLEELETVLARLGPPNQWATVGANSQAFAAGIAPFDGHEFLRELRRKSRGVLATLWRGPEDWRLAYLTFGLTLLAPVTLGFTLLLAYLLGRATVDLAREKGQPLGARRWLVYPAILMVNGSLLFGLMFGPALLAANYARWEFNDAVRSESGGWLNGERRVAQTMAEHEALYKASKLPIPNAERAYYERILAVPRQMHVTDEFYGEMVFAILVAVGPLAAWWAILGVAMWSFPKWITTVFHPLLDGYDSLHGLRLATCGGIAFFIWAGTAKQIW